MRGELLGPGGAQLVTVPGVDRLVGEGRHQLVAAHADVPVDAPERQRQADPPEGAVPRERVLVVRVDQGPVDVDEGDPLHGGAPTPRGPRLPSGGDLEDAEDAPAAVREARRVGHPGGRDVGRVVQVGRDDALRVQGPGRLGDQPARQSPAAGALVGADGDLVPVPVVPLEADTGQVAVVVVERDQDVAAERAAAIRAPSGPRPAATSPRRGAGRPAAAVSLQRQTPR